MLMKTRWFALLLLLIAPLSRAADPLPATTIQLSAVGLTNIFVQEISNLGSESEVVEHVVSGQIGQSYVQKIPGRLKWTDVTFKRGFSKSMDFAAWRKLVEDGQVNNARRTVKIIIYDQALAPVAQWNLVNAWPSAISLEQRADGSLVEVLRLVHEGMVRVQP
jgi:phage tail-like protein